MGKPRLTDADRATIRRALNDAMDERASYADAWPGDAPERVAALKCVERYEKLHRKMFGEPSQRQQDIEAFDAMPTISAHDLVLKAAALHPIDSRAAQEKGV